MFVNLESPVELLDYKLYRSKSTDNIYISFYINNISDYTVDSIKLKVHSYNQFDELLHDESEFIETQIEYSGGLKPKESRDSNEIYLSDIEDTRKVKATIEKVLFQDGTIWTNGASKLEKLVFYPIEDAESLDFLQETEGQDAKYFSKSYETRWSCVCGRLNKQQQTVCKRCSREKDIVLEAYSDDHKIKSLFKTSLDKKEKKKKRRKKISLISLSSLAFIAILVFGFLTNFTFSWHNYQLLADKDNALVAAVKEENTKDIEFLIKNEANPNFISSDGKNAISEAIKLGNESLVKTLFNEDAGQIHIGSNNDTLAHIAVQEEDLDILQQLQEYGMDINSRNNKGETVLFTAIETGNRAIIHHLVQNNEVDFDEIDKEENNVLQIALIKQADNLELLMNLTELNIDFEKKNSIGENTYETVLLTENIEIVRAFQDKELDLHNIDDSGNNALHIVLAAGIDNKSFIEELIQEDIEIQSFNSEGYTPLYYAIINNNLQAVQVLIDNNVDIYDVTEAGETALEIAENNTSRELVSVIQTHLEDIQRQLESEEALAQLDREEKQEIEKLETEEIETKPEQNMLDDIIIEYTITHDGLVEMKHDLNQINLKIGQKIILNKTYEGESYDRVLMDGSILDSAGEDSSIEAIQKGEGYLTIIPNYGDWDNSKEIAIFVE